MTPEQDRHPTKSLDPESYIGLAYTTLLTIPFDNELRIQTEKIRASLRDLIAERLGVTGEDVQTKYERMFQP